MLVMFDCEARGRVASEVQEGVPVGSVSRWHSTSLPGLFPSCAGADGSYLSLFPTLALGAHRNRCPDPPVPMLRWLMRLTSPQNWLPGLPHRAEWLSGALTSESLKTRAGELCFCLVSLEMNWHLSSLRLLGEFASLGQWDWGPHFLTDWHLGADLHSQRRPKSLLPFPMWLFQQWHFKSLSCFKSLTSPSAMIFWLQLENSLCF